MSKIFKSIKNTLKSENSKIFYILNQLPMVKHALNVEKGFIAIIPNELKKGLKDGTLKIMQGKDGSTISTIINANGKIVHQMRLNEFIKLVNPAELSQAMNQICIQVTLEEIQKNLTEFRIEINSKLNEILKNQHDNRIIKANSLKLTFERFQQGENITEGLLLSKIDDAKANLFKEIESQVAVLWDKKDIETISIEENNEIQAKIKFILEAINSLQDVYLIEYYLNSNDEDKCVEIANKYTQELLKIFSIKNFELINGFSDFNLLGLNYNIWEEKLLPMLKDLSIQYSKSKKFLVGDK